MQKLNELNNTSSSLQEPMECESPPALPQVLRESPITTGISQNQIENAESSAIHEKFKETRMTSNNKKKNWK